MAVSVCTLQGQLVVSCQFAAASGVGQADGLHFLQQKRFAERPLHHNLQKTYSNRQQGRQKIVERPAATPI